MRGGRFEKLYEGGIGARKNKIFITRPGLFYGFDGRAEVMSRVVPRVNFGKKRKEIGDEQVDFG